jgi:hypothetical protein
MEELQICEQYNMYPDIITFGNQNPSLRSPNTEFDLLFYQTRETLMDVDVYRNFIKNVLGRFRRSKYYKSYKSYLMSLGMDRCQVMGNITSEDVGERGIELHHNILNLFDIAIMMCEHTLNTVGMISTFDLMQLLIQEHFENNIPIVFLSETMHQMYTNDPNAYIPPEMTFGKWWMLLYKYRYGITLDIAYKVVKYIRMYQNRMPISIDATQQEQILSFAYYNEYGMPKEQCGYIVGEVAPDEEDY